MFSIITSLIFVALLAYLVTVNYLEFRKTDPGLSMKDRIWQTMKQSGTILWNKFVLILATIVAQLDNIADYLNMPELKNYINIALGNPKIVALVMVVISSITIAARMRRGSNDPLR